jgi:outer membrane receptor protein involved in Fe transport
MKFYTETKKKLNTILLIIVSAVFFLAVNLSAQNNAIITGKVIDKQSGEELTGANILIEGTTIGAASDLNGYYRVENIPTGNYNIRASMIGYASFKVTDVVLNPGETKIINFALQYETIETGEVIITAKLLGNNEVSLLKLRQRSISISDAISAEMMAMSGSGNAADAMNRVTGASVLNSKYVYIRGLGDRYSSTYLNGSELPSSDPDKKSFNMDLFPGNLLDNIVTVKSFTPDRPGNFSGGIVDVSTKSYPERFTLSFSTTSAFNTNTTFSNMLTYDGGSKDWIGMDDGKRNIPPGFLKDNEFPTPASSRRDPEKAKLLDDLSKSFNSEWTPKSKQAPLNQSYSFSVGNQLTLLNGPLGYTASISYSREYSQYENGKIGRYELSGPYSDAEGLRKYLELSDFRGKDEVLWGGMVNLSYKLHPLHDLSAKFLITQSGESTARFQSGEWPDQLGIGPVYETRSLLYTERNLKSYQLSGSHDFIPGAGTNLKWKASLSDSYQDEPDLRFFSNDYQTLPDGRLYHNININSYNAPTRFFRKLDEKNKTFSLDLSQPFNNWSTSSNKIKVGGAFNNTDRNFTERRFEVRNVTGSYNGNPEDYFNRNMGLIDSSNGRYTFGNYIYDATTLRSNYTGSQQVLAGYAMVELGLLEKLKFIGGTRYEITKMDVVSKDLSVEKGQLDNKDILPAASLIYLLTENMNLRAAYGRTLALPNFREMAPFRSFEFLGDFQFIGNPSIKRTLIDNFDLRWEWFRSPGEIIAVSGFYKYLSNPIERAFNPVTELVNYQNVADGKLWGAEFEMRKTLEELSSLLKGFQIGGNLTVIKSEVVIPDDEYYNNILPQDPGASKLRFLYGQSPYILNLDLSYHNVETGTSAGIYYNISGERLTEVTLGATPDVYEQPKANLDFTISQKMFFGFSIKGAAKNILNTSYKKTIKFKDLEYTYQEYKPGRNFSLSLSYSL